jgi:hypothetical protein
VQWYEILPRLGQVRQQGMVNSARHFIFNGAISPAANGTDAVIHYNLSSATLLPRIRARSRTQTTTLGTITDEITLGRATTHSQDYTCGLGDGRPGCRWGDYVGASPDPSAGAERVVWGSNQLLGPANENDPHWTIRNFALTPVG